ncbi:DUF2971 domain-containing protein [Klebsiella sp. GG_Kp146]|uniref:DUF2971 domain-containing protein n=1 Tax=Klebsiella sp. GG_Kp146 TaxID=3153457 RepID=UPI0032B489F5
MPYGEDSILKNIIDIDSLDMSIYRIFSIKYFEELITNKELVLVQPDMWDDPYENFILKTEVDLGDGTIASLEELKSNWYGQCWTENIDTDAMWRIYSPNKDGIRVKTTAKKLFDIVYNSLDEYAKLKYFIGKVSYKEKQEIINFVTKSSFSEIILGGQNDSFAKLLCTKRTAFSHENEIRVLVDDIHNKKGDGGLYKIDIEPMQLFDEVCLDPRLSDIEANNLKAKLVAMGVTCKILQSDLYKLTLPRLRIS